MSDHLIPFIVREPARLEQLAEKYPWCSLAQLSLLHYYRENGLPATAAQAQKVALFFNNIPWLEWQMETGGHPEPAITTEEAVVLPEAVAANKAVMAKEEELPGANEVPGENELTPSMAAEAPPAEEELAFEPLHTTDYFASQGIRLTDEPVSRDKLGSQVKSFTEWLKSMKKIHPAGAAVAADPTDRNIQELAEVSNVGSEVVTEAMAEVLVKQNKTLKAIELYRKLSLINPSKSAYFAAKIDGLSTGPA